MHGPFVHYSDKKGISGICHTNELWGTTARSGVGVGGTAARAWMGTLAANPPNVNKGGVEFETDAEPDYPLGGPRIVIWRPNSPGVKWDDPYVKVPIVIRCHQLP
jgi:hypothetical protein